MMILVSAALSSHCSEERGVVMEKSTAVSIEKGHNYRRQEEHYGITLFVASMQRHGRGDLALVVDFRWSRGNGEHWAQVWHP